MRRVCGGAGAALWRARSRLAQGLDRPHHHPFETGDCGGVVGAEEEVEVEVEARGRYQQRSHRQSAACIETNATYRRCVQPDNPSPAPDAGAQTLHTCARTREQGKGDLKRVEEVFDCWFESGSMPYAQCHYPFENKEQFEGGFPADFIAEVGGLLG